MQGTTLNLGCGTSYRASCINIDFAPSAVVDVRGDITRLPVRSRSAEAVELMQVIEHFDVAHVRYFLSECYRSLKPGGRITIETPDLMGSVKKMASTKLHDRDPAIQWIFGIDSPGLQHRIGFDKGSIRDLLEESGFNDIRFEKPTTYTSEPGIRCVASKPIDGGSGDLMATFRSFLRSTIGTDDSYILIPMEKSIRSLRDWTMRWDGRASEELHLQMALATVHHPGISRSFLEACVLDGRIPDSVARPWVDMLGSLEDMRFHERLLTLWMKSSKGTDTMKAFEDFKERIGSKILACIKVPADMRESLSFIGSLEPTPIGIFDLILIQSKSMGELGGGVKEFEGGHHELASNHFENALALDPRNMLAHWNLARLACIERKGDLAVIHYESAIELCINRGLRGRIAGETEHARGGEFGSVPSAPIDDKSVGWT